MISQVFLSLEKALLYINKVFTFFGSLLLIGLMVCTNSDLFLRFFFHSPIVGMNEITEISLLYITFLGTAYVYHHDAHVVVDMLLYKIYSKSKKILTLINHGLVGLVSLILICSGSLTTLDHLQRNARNPTILETPVALIIMIIPIGAAILFFEALIKFYNALKKQTGGEA